MSTKKKLNKLVNDFLGGTGVLKKKKHHKLHKNHPENIGKTACKKRWELHGHE